MGLIITPVESPDFLTSDDSARFGALGDGNSRSRYHVEIGITRRRYHVARTGAENSVTAGGTAVYCSHLSSDRRLSDPTHSDTGDTMMMSLYVILGIFLLIASRNPSAHRSLIALAAWSSFAHAVTMSILGLEIASQRVGFSNLSE